MTQKPQGLSKNAFIMIAVCQADSSSAWLVQVLGKAFEVVTHLVNNSNVSKKDAFTAIGGLVDKISDIKLKSQAGEALFAISETINPQFVFIQLHKKAANHKNPKASTLAQLLTPCFWLHGIQNLVLL